MCDYVSCTIKHICVHSVWLSSVSQSCLTLCNPMDCSTPALSITNTQSLIKYMSIELVMSSNHLILCRPLLLPPSIFLRIRIFQMSQIFSNESDLHIRWPKHYFRAVLCSQKYRHVGSEIFHILPFPHKHSLPHCQHFPPETYICYN